MKKLKKKLNILIYGYGSHGSRVKNLLDELNGKEYLFNVFGICTSLKKDSDIKIFTSIEEIKYKNIDIDCVFITTPDDTHIKVFQKCVSSEIPYIYVEKPAFEIEEYCQKNIQFLIKKIKYIQIGYHFNYENGFKELSRIIKNNEMGELLRLEIFSGHGLAFKNNFKNSWRSKNDDQLFQTVMSHLLNYVINISENTELKNKISFLKKSNENGFYDTCHMSGIFPNGGLYSLTASWGSPLKNIVRAYFSDGFWSYDNDIGEIYIESPRDIFDDNHYFIKPYLKTKKVEINGLKNSILYFIGKCYSNKFFDYEFNNSELTSKILSEKKFK